MGIKYISPKLSGAMFCLDCDELTETVETRTLDGRGGRRIANACGVCGGRALWPLTAWIQPTSQPGLRHRKAEIAALERMCGGKDAG